MRLVLLLFLVVFVRPFPIAAKYDPLSAPNNPYGIHIVEVNDLADAAQLVNSSGGDWGYVTLVMQEDDRDLGKWQGVFNRMRALHLIPIVRLATHIDGDAWVKPYKDAALDWARFLNSLNWPTENRYVIIFNEPNHANEWGKSLEPEEYARTLVQFARTLKGASEDFFILPAGLDVSAGSDGRSLDAGVYLRRMLSAEPTLFEELDGWTSHSYPNPAFSGSPFASGRGTLRSYIWEINLIRTLGIQKTLPVFITETGWVHSQGVIPNRALMSPERIGENIKIAAAGVWTDPTVVAVTPFVLNYQGLPFDHFSWKQLGSNDYYSFYQTYRDVPKTAGRPRQREKYTLDQRIIPESLVGGSTYVLSALLKNEGQGILSQQDGAYKVKLATDPLFLMVTEPLPVMEPGQFGTLTLHTETPNIPGTYDYSLYIEKNGERVPLEEGKVRLVPPPKIELSVQLGWKPVSDTPEATVLVYDNLTLLHKFEGVEVINGKATVGELRNVVPGRNYRVVVLVPYYLPRQHIGTVHADVTAIRMTRMYPLDFDRNGELSLADIIAGVRQPPNVIMSLFFGR